MKFSLITWSLYPTRNGLESGVEKDFTHESTSQCSFAICLRSSPGTLLPLNYLDHFIASATACAS